jgi:hypothetical protein
MRLDMGSAKLQPKTLRALETRYHILTANANAKSMRGISSAMLFDSVS